MAQSRLGRKYRTAVRKGRRTRKGRLTLKEALAKAEREHILYVLSLTEGRRAEAAGILGISRKSLWERIRQHGLEDELR